MAVTSLNVRSMSATGRKGKAPKYFSSVLLGPVPIGQADLLQTFHQSLSVVKPTPGDRNGVAEHGPDGNYLAASTWIGEVRLGLELTLLIGKPY